jgi:phage terminase large subunit
LNYVPLLRQPHAQQQLAIDASDPEQLYGGAKRGGKSVWLAIKITMLAVLFPGNRILLARRNMTDLKDTTLKEFFLTCPEELAWGGSWEKAHNKGDRIIKLKTIDPKRYSEIVYRGLGDSGDVDKAKSLTVGAMAIDEPSEVELATYLQLRAQMTHVLPDGTRPPYMSLLACNPEPGWVKDRFITKKIPGCVFIPSLPRDNPYLPPGYEAGLRTAGYDPDWIEKYLNGSWAVAEGTVFTMFDKNIHCIEKLSPAFLKQCKFVAALDHGMSGTTAMVLDAIDPDGNEFTVAEYYEQNKLISEHARAIQHLWLEFGLTPNRISQILIDPSTVAKTLQGTNELESVRDEYARQGIPAQLAYNAIEIGIDSMKEMLTIYPTHHHPLYVGVIGAPAWYIVKDRCPNLIREIEEFKKEIKPNGKVDWVGSDHALDCKRYIRNARPRRPLRTAADEAKDPPPVRAARRSHDRWAKQFDRQVNGSVTWYSPRA